MKPIKMLPAFRYGSATPWGCEGLRALHKEIPDSRTGESLEVSVLPGLESRDSEGHTLSEARYEGRNGVSAVAQTDFCRRQTFRSGASE